MLEIKSNKNEEFDKIIRTNLRKFNKSKCQWMKDNLDDIPEDDYYNFAVYDDGKLVGGATGIIEFDWYFLEELWIDEKYRNKHIGSKLMKTVENYYENKGFENINLTTYGFQAPEFYKKCGFEIEFVRKNKENPKLNKYYLVKYF